MKSTSASKLQSSMTEREREKSVWGGLTAEALEPAGHVGDARRREPRRLFAVGLVRKRAAKRIWQEASQQAATDFPMPISSNEPWR
jgi:hypothetical protein